MEEKLPKDSEGSTLWECEELALRYLLEDGKMNLCLRLMDQPVCGAPSATYSVHRAALHVSFRR